MLDPRLIADIKNAEGCSLAAYRDTLGYWTIGYGHLLDQNDNWGGHTISSEQADKFLEEDATIAASACTYYPEWKSLDTLARQNAVIELRFNLGSRWKLFAQTRLDIQNKNWKKAHDDLLNSLWAKQVGTKRSNRLANYLLTGEYP